MYISKHFHYACRCFHIIIGQYLIELTSMDKATDKIKMQRLVLMRHAWEDVEKWIWHLTRDQKVWGLILSPGHVYKC